MTLRAVFSTRKNIRRAELNRADKAFTTLAVPLEKPPTDARLNAVDRRGIALAVRCAVSPLNGTVGRAPHERLLGQLYRPFTGT
jgi:hypothetical protein